jgi:hypothetical protein
LMPAPPSENRMAAAATSSLAKPGFGSGIHAPGWRRAAPSLRD